MKKIVWHPKLNTGVEQVDDQHKRLVQLTNNLASSINSGVAEDVLGVFCKELYDYTVFHFRDEELLMEEAGYPHLDTHKAKHRDITDKVKAFQDSLEGSETVPPKELLNFMSEWLVEHIIYMDMKIADHIKSQKSEQVTSPEE